MQQMHSLIHIFKANFMKRPNDKFMIKKKINKAKIDLRQTYSCNMD